MRDGANRDMKVGGEGDVIRPAPALLVRPSTPIAHFLFSFCSSSFFFSFRFSVVFFPFNALVQGTYIVNLPFGCKPVG